LRIFQADKAEKEREIEALLAKRNSEVQPTPILFRRPNLKVPLTSDSRFFAFSLCRRAGFYTAAAVLLPAHAGCRWQNR